MTAAQAYERLISHAYAPLALKLLTGALVVLIALQVARLFWLLLPTPDLPAPRVTPILVPQASGESIASWHLFGEAGRQVATAPTTTAPVTELALTLIGTFAGDVATQSLAIIENEDGEQGLHGIGDTIQDGVRVAEIYPDRVILVRAAGRETLPLDFETFDASSPRAARTAGATDRPIGIPGIRGSASDGGVATPRFDAIDWQQAQARLKLDANQIAQNVRGIVHTEDGRQVGIRLSAGQDSQTLSRLGLRPSDVITEVNGLSLTDPSSVFAAMQQLQNETQFNVKLRRNGQIITRQIDLNVGGG